MILATISVFFRDMEYIWDVFMMLLMYCSAIMYTPDRIMKSGFSWILKYNPLYCIIMNFRYAMMGEPLDMGYILMALAYGIGLSLIGTYIFYKKQDEFILAI